MADMTPRAVALSELFKSKMSIMPADVRKAVSLSGKGLYTDGDLSATGISAEALTEANDWAGMRTLLGVPG